MIETGSTNVSVIKDDIAGPKPRKLFTVDELAILVRTLKSQGRRVIQCHGVFDLLHIGHIRHLEEARSLGDILIVSITEDQYVNKGPHRPAFPELLRAEALAALAVVDYVTISRNPTAVEAIALLAPDVFVKGPDYRNQQSDITGGIGPEEQAARASGGVVHFTNDVTFSSSNLINQFLETFPPEMERYLRSFRQRYSARDVIESLDRLQSLKVAVVGEAILDEYVYCDQMGKSAKDPVLAMRYDSRELFAGGALAVANHVANFVHSVELISFIGSEDSQESFIRNSLKSNVRPNFIYKSNSPTIVKRRYVESYLRSKHFEVYFINDEPINASEEHQLCSLFEARLPSTDAVIASDFGHGLLTPAAIANLSAHSSFLAVNTQINAANIRYHAISNYDHADYICINEQEIRLDARSRRGELSGLVRNLADRLDCKRVLVTRGSSGVVYFHDGTEFTCPSFTSKVIDRTGSGDAVLAITSVAAQAGIAPEVLAFLANIIGAQKVQVVGNRSSTERVATIRFIEALLK